MPQDNPLAEEAPLFFIIGRNCEDMSDVELTQHLNELRALRGSAATRRSRVSKKKATSKSKVNFDHLFNSK